MSNPYIIEDNILIGYDGPGGDLILPDGLRGVGERTFHGRCDIRSVVIPEDYRFIGDYAFYGCSRLESVTLPSSMANIGAECFRDCICLRELNWDPPWVYDIGNWAFKNCRSLANKEGFIIFDNTVFDYIGPGGKVVLPEKYEWLSSIGEGAFYCRSDITEVVFPKQLIVIRSGAFAHCSGLRELVFPKQLRTVQTMAFWKSGVSRVHLPTGPVSIWENAFPPGCVFYCK